MALGSCWLRRDTPRGENFAVYSSQIYFITYQTESSFTRICLQRKIRKALVPIFLLLFLLYDCYYILLSIYLWSVYVRCCAKMLYYVTPLNPPHNPTRSHRPYFMEEAKAHPDRCQHQHSYSQPLYPLFWAKPPHPVWQSKGTLQTIIESQVTFSGNQHPHLVFESAVPWLKMSPQAFTSGLLSYRSLNAQHLSFLICKME